MFMPKSLELDHCMLNQDFSFLVSPRLPSSLLLFTFSTASRSTPDYLSETAVLGHGPRPSLQVRSSHGDTWPWSSPLPAWPPGPACREGGVSADCWHVHSGPLLPGERCLQVTDPGERRNSRIAQGSHSHTQQTRVDWLISFLKTTMLSSHSSEDPQ